MRELREKHQDSKSLLDDPEYYAAMETYRQALIACKEAEAKWTEMQSQHKAEAAKDESKDCWYEYGAEDDLFAQKQTLR